MPMLLYLHGFLSSPASSKAEQVRDWVANHRPDIHYQCPLLTPYFGETAKTLEALVKDRLPDPVYLMGSSMGGYLATWLAEKYDLRAVLINPAVQPSVLDHGFVGMELRNYHTGDRYVLTEAHISELKALHTPVIQRPGNYWLMVQRGDETLDYRLAVEKYRDCEQLVEAGGDHGFMGFEQYIPEAIRFLSGR